MNSTLLIAFALGIRHGTDPDHLTAIDGLSRLRPRAANGLLFAIGHGSVVTLLAAGVGHVLAGRVAFLGPWMLMLDVVCDRNRNARLGAFRLSALDSRRALNADARIW